MPAPLRPFGYSDPGGTTRIPTLRLQTPKIMAERKQNSAPNVSEELRKWRKLDDLTDVQRRVIRALRTCDTIMYADHTPDEERRKCATTVSQLARTYLKCLEVGEYEERIRALEEAIQHSGTINGVHRR